MINWLHAGTAVVAQFMQLPICPRAGTLSVSLEVREMRKAGPQDMGLFLCSPMKTYLTSALFMVYMQAPPSSAKGLANLKMATQTSLPPLVQLCRQRWEKIILGTTWSRTLICKQILKMPELSRRWRRSWQAGEVGADGTTGVVPCLQTRDSIILKRRQKEDTGQYICIYKERLLFQFGESLYRGPA